MPHADGRFHSAKVQGTGTRARACACPGAVQAVCTADAANPVAETRVKLRLGGGDDQHSDVSLGRAGDHVWDEVPVSRGVQQRVAVAVGGEVHGADVHRDATGTLFFVLV